MEPKEIAGFRSPKLAVTLRRKALVANGEVRANAYLLPIALGQTCFRYCTAFSFW